MRSTTVKIAALALMLLTAGTASARAEVDDRMAGKPHIAKPSSAAPADAQKTAAAYQDAAPEAPASHGNVLKVSYPDLESYGLLHKSAEGGLGADLWSGSKRSTITTYMPELPGDLPYRTAQDLAKRLLLTSVDARLMTQDQKPVPGEDLLTQRLEKLLEMGAYQEALALYTKEPGEAYHERYARAGVLAALYSQQPALACLETNIVAPRFDDVFWKQVAGYCSYIMAKSSGVKTGSVEIPGSKILQKAVDKDSFRFKVTGIEDLKTLEPVEAAIMAADGRLDLSGFAVSGETARELPLHVLTYLMNEPSLSEEGRFTLTLAAVARGEMPVKALGSFYEKQALAHFGKKTETSLVDYLKINGWTRLPYLFRATANAKQAPEQAAVIEKLLALVSSYDSAAFWPFAGTIAGLDPAILDSASIRPAFTVMLGAGIPIPENWAKVRFAHLSNGKPENTADFLQFLAYAATNNVPGGLAQGADFSAAFTKLSGSDRQIVGIVYEKLDKKDKLHNYYGDDAYEKEMGLTFADDYVMPLVGLVDSLKDAKSDKRLGEVILLSSIALRDAAPEKKDTGLLSEVFDGYVTVGLIKEAHSLAREIMMGLYE